MKIGLGKCCRFAPFARQAVGFAVRQGLAASCRRHWRRVPAQPPPPPLLPSPPPPQPPPRPPVGARYGARCPGGLWLATRRCLLEPARFEQLLSCSAAAPKAAAAAQPFCAADTAWPALQTFLQILLPQHERLQHKRLHLSSGGILTLENRKDKYVKQDPTRKQRSALAVT